MTEKEYVLYSIREEKYIHIDEGKLTFNRKRIMGTFLNEDDIVILRLIIEGIIKEGDLGLEMLTHFRVTHLSAVNKLVCGIKNYKKDILLVPIRSPGLDVDFINAFRYSSI